MRSTQPVSSGRLVASTPRLAATLCALALLGSSARADTIHVPKDFPTLSLALASADVTGADTLVLTERITDNVVIPAGYDGLTIQGAGKNAILDAHDPDDLGAEAGIVVRSTGVTLRQLTVRFSKGPAILGGKSHQLRLEDCRFVNCANDFGTFGNCLRPVIDLVGHDVVVESCQIQGSHNGALFIMGDRSVVRRSTARGVRCMGLELEGHDVVIEKNHVSQLSPTYDLFGQRIAAYAVLVRGHGARIDRNLIHNVDSGIAVEGDEMPEAETWVNANRLTAVTGGGGIRVEDAQARITRNVVKDCAGPAFLARDCAHSSLVERNQARGARSTGFGLFDNEAVVVRKNQALDCLSGMAVSSVDARVEGNLIRNSLKDGLWCGGATGLTLRRNRVLGSGADGLTITTIAMGALLEKNVVKGSASEGLDNRGQGTLLRGNTFTGNRIDVVNSGSLTIEPNNKIGDGSDGSLESEI